MVDAEASAVVANIDEFDKYFNFLKRQYDWNRVPIGFKIENTSSDPKVTRIDRYGETFNPEPDFFYNHELYYMPKVLLSSTGVETKGIDLIGSNLDFTGTSGDAMVWCNNAKVKYWYEDDSNTQFYLYAPFDSNHPGFDYHPNCRAGGGTLHDHYYMGAYEASLGFDSSGNTVLKSIAGVQPWSGREIYSLNFTSGGPTAFAKGELLTGAVSGTTGYVVDYHATNTDWVGGNAAGTVYLCNPGIAINTLTDFTNEVLNISGVDRASSISGYGNIFATVDNALTYATNKGLGWTLSDIYASSLLQGLFYTQYGTRNSESAIGSGIVDFPSLGGFVGKNTGVDNIDTVDRLNNYGTGVGNGPDGYTPIRWNNLENLWGNLMEHIIGINIIDGTCRVTKLDGTGELLGTLPTGSYDTLPGMLALESGYISKVQTDKLGALLFLPAVTSGTSSSEYCDFYTYSSGTARVLLRGGDGDQVGISSFDVASGYGSDPADSDRVVGFRLKYIPQS